MSKIKLLAVCAASAGALVATSAEAVVTTFASFSPLAGGSNLRWKNSSGAANGTGGELYTIDSYSSTTAGSRAVSFSFLQPALAAQVSGVTALFTMNAAAPTGNGVSVDGTRLIQGGVAGSFSFTSTSAITIGDTVFAAGSNLLTATFGNSTITGERLTRNAVFEGSSAGGDNVIFSSDFLNFASVNGSDFAMGFADLFNGIQASPTGPFPTSALRTFRATAGGSFTADLGPVVPPLPEPATWALLTIGFGFVGSRLRRQKVALETITA